MGTPRCSVIVPTYNTAQLLRRCLDALLASLAGRVDVEVVVCDDGSTDPTPDVVAGYGPAVVSTRLPTNQGFSLACNTGAAAASGRFLVFYNSDLVPHNGWLDALLDYAEADPSRAIVGVRLLFPDGRLQHCGVVTCSDGFPRHVYAGFPGDHPAALRSGPVEIVTGACLLIRAGAFAELGGFDTGYRNGYEDVDLCLRAGLDGHAVHYCHTSVLTHWVSATREHRRAEFLANEERYLRRWGGRPATDLTRYVADGLLRVEYGRVYPMRLVTAPELAITDRAGDAEEPLRDMLHELRRENVRLRMQVLGDRPSADSAATDDATPNEF